jgi:hypothetical protein
LADTVPLDRQVTLGDDALPGEARIINAAERALTGQRRGARAVLPFLGPAFIAAVAYVDPGNFATNMAGGSEFGYTLLWVVLAANLMAMLIQSLSAKLGIATGRSLPEICRDKLPFRTVVLLWLQAEAAAMATDPAAVLHQQPQTHGGTGEPAAGGGGRGYRHGSDHRAELVPAGLGVNPARSGSLA